MQQLLGCKDAEFNKPSFYRMNQLLLLLLQLGSYRSHIIRCAVHGTRGALAASFDAECAPSKL